MAVSNITDENFKSTLESNDKVAVKYFADWCGSCKLIAPKYRRIADNAHFGDTAFIEVNAEHNAEARKIAEVDSLPYFAVFKHGKLVSGLATSKAEVVEELINKLA